MTIQFSRRLAIAAGFALPVLATARRWHQLSDPLMWLVWLDDWAIAGFLLYGAWRTRRELASGQPALAAAWGFACGMAYASFVFALLTINRMDPSGLQSSVVATIKGVMLALAITALTNTLRWKPAANAAEVHQAQSGA